MVKPTLNVKKRAKPPANSKKTEKVGVMETENLNKFLSADLGKQIKNYIKKTDYLNVIGSFDIIDIETETKVNKKGFNYIQTTIQLTDKKTLNTNWIDLRQPQAQYLKQYLLANRNPELYLKAHKNEDKTFTAFISFDKLQWI